MGGDGRGPHPRIRHEGERRIAAVPHGHWKTTTFVATLRLTGMVAPMVADGALTGDPFAAYARQRWCRCCGRAMWW